MKHTYLNAFILSNLLLTASFSSVIGATFMAGTKLTYNDRSFLVVRSVSNIEAEVPERPLDVVIIGKSLVYPNPATEPRALLAYTLNTASNLEVRISDLFGKLVKTILLNKFDEGARSYYNKLHFDLKDNSGKDLGNGVYVIYIIDTSRSKVLSKTKMVITR